MKTPLRARVAEICDQLLADASCEGIGRSTIGAVREGLDEPLRIAVAGRVNAGKSTLVNAFLGQRVAPTDVSECTRLVTWYRYGVPERVEAWNTEGVIDQMPLRADGTLPASLGTRVDEISHLVVYISNQALRDLVIIDTPGLSSVNDEYSKETRELLAIDRSSRSAIGRADALVLVMTGSLHEDEVDAVASFRAHFSGLPLSALNAVGVLNKADQIGGAGDPRVAAGVLARDYTEALRSSVAAVVPMIGLHAETAECALLSERDAVNLREIAGLDDTARRALLLTVDRFVSSEAPVEAEDRVRLLDRLDLYGIERCLEAAANGKASSTQLTAELRKGSGIEQLRRVLDETFARNADALKASWALAALDRVAYDNTGIPWSQTLRDQIEDLRLDPAMHRLVEIRAVQEWASGAVTLRSDLARSLHRLVTGFTVADRFDLSEDTTAAELQRVAAEAAQSWREYGNDPRATPGQRWLADVACRSCELAWTHATWHTDA